MFTNRPLYTQGKSPWYLLDRRLGVPQIRSGYSGEEKNSKLLPGFETPNHPARSPLLCLLFSVRGMRHVTLLIKQKKSNSRGEVIRDYDMEVLEKCKKEL
jgi:hypothetical protein